MRLYDNRLRRQTTRRVSYRELVTKVQACAHFKIQTIGMYRETSPAYSLPRPFGTSLLPLPLVVLSAPGLFLLCLFIFMFYEGRPSRLIYLILIALCGTEAIGHCFQATFFHPALCPMLTSPLALEVCCSCLFPNLFYKYCFIIS